MSAGSEIGLWALLVIASVTDLVWGKIYNLVSFFFLFAGVLYQFSLGGWRGGISSLLGIVVAFALFFPLYRFRVFAAGDVKLLMAAGAWSDYRVVLELGLGAILMGALVGVIVLLRAAGLKSAFGSVLQHLGGQRSQSAGPRKSHRMPFAPAFLCALFVLKIAEKYQWGALL